MLLNERISAITTTPEMQDLERRVQNLWDQTTPLFQPLNVISKHRVYYTSELFFKPCEERNSEHHHYNLLALSGLQRSMPPTIYSNHEGFSGNLQPLIQPTFIGEGTRGLNTLIAPPEVINTFYDRIDFEGFWKAALGDIFLGRIDGRAITLKDGNYLFKENPDGSLLPMIIDTEDSLPNNNYIIQCTECQAIIPLRSGILGFPQGERILPEESCEELKELVDGWDPKLIELYMKRYPASFSESQINALLDRIQSIKQFAQESDNFNMRELAGAAFPFYNRSWKVYQEYTQASAIAIAHLIGSNDIQETLPEERSRFNIFLAQQPFIT
ncbi:MAG: hypothetical protein ACQEP8_02270 [Chlamydiota bacterium]